MALVQFYDVTPEQFKSLATKDESVLYFLSNGQLYKGGQLIGNNIELITDSFPSTGVKGILYIKPSTGESKYWDGTQFLDFTKEITTLINAASTDEEIPTAAAVRTYASSVATDKANAAQSNAETNANKYTDSVKTALQALINKKAPSADGVSADSALKLTTSAGDVNKPVYFKNGVPVGINYTINKTVPSDAKFTDTTYENATQSAAGLMSAEDKKRLDGLTSGDKNQNAFSKVAVGSSTIEAETTTDTLTIAAGTNITLTPDVSTDKITIAAKDTTYTKGAGINISDTNVISNSGVRSISSGSANGTISVNTNGTTADVAVKGLGSAAYATKGGANGVAELDANGKVLTSQLPSYVDEVVEYSGLANFPTTGTTGIIYVDTAANKTYRWSGTQYVEISASLALGNTSSTAFRGDYGHTLYSNLNVSKGSDTKPIYLKDGVPTEVASEYVTLDTTQTITGNKTFTGIFDFSNTTGKLSSHYYHRLYSDNHVYVHYYPGVGDASTPTTFADLRVWDAINGTFKTLQLGGDGTLRWDDANIITSGGGTITGRLNTNDLKNLGHYSMLNKKNFSMIANANDSEFSFDIGASDIGLSSDSGYTGAYAQFWSCKNSKPVAIFRNDDMSVSIPNGGLSLGEELSVEGVATFKTSVASPYYIANEAMTLDKGKVAALATGTSRLYANALVISNPTTMNDQGWIRVLGTGEKDTVLEIATGDDGSTSGDGEAIVVRQYNTQNTIARQAKLLDTSGNTSFPGNVTALSFNNFIFSEENFYYKYTESVSLVTNDTWYIKIVLNRKWNPSKNEYLLSAAFDNINGKVYFALDSYNDKWKCYRTNYNGSNITAIGCTQNSGTSIIYLQMAGAKTENGTATCTIYSSQQITSMEIVDSVNIPLQTLRYGYNANTDITTTGTIYGNLSGNASSAGQVYVQNTNPSASTTYYVPFHEGNATSRNKSLYTNDGFRYYTRQGTTSSGGVSSLGLGNAIATGSDTNKMGTIYFYGNGTGYTEIFPSNHTSTSINLYLPAEGGTLARTVDTVEKANKLLLAQGTADVARPIIFQDSGLSTSELLACEDNDFTYNPSKNILYTQHINPYSSIGKESYILYPSGGTYVTSSNTHTGYLKITFPVSWTSTMLRFRVSIYNYVAGTMCDYYIGGYNYSSGTSSGWHQCTAYSTGRYDSALANLPVTFGHDGTKCAVTIGKADTAWSYIQVQISEVQCGYMNYTYDSWYKGWSINFTTTALSNAVTYNTPHVSTYAGNADTLDGYHGSVSATKNTYVLRSSDNYIYTNYINSNTSNNENPSISQVIVTNGTDHFYRKASLAHFRTSLGLTYDIKEAYITSGFNTSFRTTVKGSSANGTFLSVIRSNSTLSGYITAYASGLTWGKDDTQGFISVGYNDQTAYIGGGNADKLNWVKQICFTDHTHSYLPLSAGASYPLTGALYFKTNSWTGDIIARNASNQPRYEIFSGNSSGAVAPLYIRVFNNEAGSTYVNYLFGTDGTLTATKFSGTLSGTASSANWLNTNSALTYGASGLQYFNFNGTEGTTANANVTPTSAYYHILRMNHANNNGYFADIAIPLNDVNGVYWRQVRGGTNRGWYKFLDSNNYNIYALPLSGGTMTGKITGSTAQGSWISCTRNGAFRLETAATGGAASSVISMKTASGAWSITNLSGSDTLYFCFGTDTNYTNGNNTITQITFSGSTITANLSGNASTATTASNLSGFVNTTTSGTAIDSAITNGHYYVTGTSGIYSQSDGSAFVQAYSSSWVSQIYQDYRTGQIALRGKNNGTWQAWRKVLDSRNYTSYVVPNTGGTFTGNIFTQHAIGGETQVGVKHNTGSLYFWGNNSTGTRGIYDSKKGYIIQVSDTATTFTGSLSGNASSATTANNVASTGFGTTCFTYFQTSNSFAGSAASWAGYLISNHGAGATQYNQILRMPFWDTAPQYSYMSNGTQSEWYTLHSTGNSSKSATYSSGLSIGNVKMAGSTSYYYVPYATASQSGAVSTAAQTFAGVKTFNNGLASNGNISLANSAYIVGKNSAGTECRMLTITGNDNIGMNTSYVGNVNIYGYAEQSFDPGFSDGPTAYAVNLYMRNAATSSNVNLFSVGGNTTYGNTAVSTSSNYYYSTVRSSGIYNRTTTSAANVFISSSGSVLMRSTSASKYKLNIKKIEQPDSYYYNTLKLSPKQWNDKGSIEAYANYLTRSINNDKIKEDKEEKEFLNNIDITPVYGLVAEDVEKAGLEKYCVYAYDEETQKNEIEGIQYDRLWIPLIPIVRDIVLSMQKILPVIIPSIRDEETLAEVLKLLNKFNSFNEADVID